MFLAAAALALMPFAAMADSHAAAGSADLVNREVLQEKLLTGHDEMVVIVSKLVLAPGGRIPLHTHPGDEHAVIVTGGTATMPDGSTMDFADDTVMFFPAGMVHGGVTNAGETPIEILTTHVLEEGRPFQTLAE
ncbi:hypothetical protein AVJ23_03335 [Pseudoponticoccus marisrubri]|uniref:Cupin type-2 domain-containing protein n=2 Tax=Pseudoponticoccus marisrubri TaxID=1685382 RepID=A0A0W7WQH3_9RHOB|nr:hypothetical protein AVJ23_03335 [Pseudoponticoccus marisrubri]